MTLRSLPFWVTLLGAALVAPGHASAWQGGGLTAVPGIKVGHYTLSERPTGCTVVLIEDSAVGGVDVRGAAPGTRETVLLDPVNTIQRVHAVVLSGGSAFGLAAADGVVRYLEERQIGLDVGVARVPIVPGAILFDLGVGGKPDVRPTAECGYRAAEAANDGPVAEGNVGAGAGATVGKLFGSGRAMKGGIGSAARELPSGLIVAALVAVNAVGDVIDPNTGAVVAGARTADGRGLADVRDALRRGLTRGRSDGQNTTLAVVATNARLDKAQVNKIAQMAHDGFARAIYPVHPVGRGRDLLAGHGGVPGPRRGASDRSPGGRCGRRGDRAGGARRRGDSRVSGGSRSQRPLMPFQLHGTTYTIPRTSAVGPLGPPQAVCGIKLERY